MRQDRVYWKNLRDGAGVVHAAKSAWTTRCGRRFIENSKPVVGVKTTAERVTCPRCSEIERRVK